MNERCENCRFWVPGDESSGGTCHRFPPVTFGRDDFDGDVLQAIPVTGAQFWCGEHEPIEGDEEQPDQTLDSDGPERDDDAL